MVFTCPHPFCHTHTHTETHTPSPPAPPVFFLTLQSCWVTLVPSLWSSRSYSKPGSYHYGNKLMLLRNWWDLCIRAPPCSPEMNSPLCIIMFPSLALIMSLPHFPLSTSPPVSGECNLFMHWTGFCCHDLRQPPELPPLAGGDRTGLNGHVSRASVSDVEQGGAAADLWSSQSRWCSLAVPEQSKAPSTGAQVWQGATTAQHRSVWPKASSFLFPYLKFVLG